MVWVVSVGINRVSKGIKKEELGKVHVYICYVSGWESTTVSS